MLLKEYNHMLKNIKKIQTATSGIKKGLRSILQRHDRTFLVSIGEKKWDLSYPVTLDEKQRLDRDIEEISSELLKVCLYKFADNLTGIDEDFSIWSNILVFCSGDPIESFQIEKIHDSEIKKIDEDGNLITAIALNQESDYILWQDPKLWEKDENLE